MLSFLWSRTALFRARAGACVAGDKKAILVPGPFGHSTIRFEDVPIHYQIDGTVRTEQVVVNPCQMQVDAVQDAQDAPHGLEVMKQSLQHQLGHASPAAKPGIIAAIWQISEQQIPAAEKRIKIAQQALRFCEITGGGLTPPERPEVLEPVVG